MKINVQATNFNVDQKLVDFTQRKIDKLYKFYDKILTVDVFFKVENTPTRINKFTEIKVMDIFNILDSLNPVGHNNLSDLNGLLH